jgi:hypothetical protein
VARPKVDDRFQRVWKIFDAECLLSLLRQMRTGAEKPLQIAQHALAISLQGNNPLRTAFLRIVRFIISQPIEQAGLKSFDNGKLRHEVILLNRYRNSKLKRLNATELHHFHLARSAMAGANR